MLGNLETRTDATGMKALTERFTYDNLNRLTSSQVTGQTAMCVSYDAHGNITSKTGVGSYTYGAGNAGPHAVITVGSTPHIWCPSRLQFQILTQKTCPAGPDPTG